MPEFDVTAPNGKSYHIVGPEGSTQAQALQKAMEQHARATGDYQVDQAGRRLDFAQKLGAAFPEQFPDPAEIDPFAAERGPAIPAENANFGASLKAGIIADPDTSRREIAKSLFPDDPNGMQRVGFMDGKPVYVNDKGELQRVSPSLIGGAAELVANTPEAVGSVIGSFATGNPVAGAAVGAAGGKALKRGVSELVFDEPATPASVGKEMAGEVAVNALAGGAGKALTGFAGRSKIVDLAPRDVKTAEQLRTYVKQSTGIDLDLAQASGDRMLLGLRDFAASYPGKTAELFQAADEVAAGQLDTATNRVLDVIARSTPSEISGRAGVNAAEAVIRAARLNVSQSVRPLYEAAYEAVPQVNNPQILGLLKLPYFREAFAAGQKLRTLETRAAQRPSRMDSQVLTERNADGSTTRTARRTDTTQTGAIKTRETITNTRQEDVANGTLTTSSELRDFNITNPSLQELDYTKRALDEKIESLAESGQRQRARVLRNTRNEFVAALDAIPNQPWQAARAEYGELARSQIEPLENGVIGVLAKIKDPTVSRAAVKVFSDPNVSPQAINLAKTALERQSPEAYAGLVRQYLGHRWNQAMKSTQGGDVINPAGKFRQAVYGTPGDKEKMRAMLPAGAGSAFDDLMLAMEKLSRTPLGASRIAGSPTFSRTEMNESLKGHGGVGVKWLTTPRKAVIDAAEERAKQQSLQGITEALLDPAKRNQLRSVARMQPGTKQAVLLGTILTGQAAADIAPEEIPGMQ